MASGISLFWTVARIAEHLGVERHRVEYVIDSRGLEPVGRAGIARLFDQDTAERIGNHIKQIDAHREEVSDGA